MSKRKGGTMEMDGEREGGRELKQNQGEKAAQEFREKQEKWSDRRRTMWSSDKSSGRNSVKSR